VTLLRRDERHTRRSFYRYIFKIDPGQFGEQNNAAVCDALDAEGIPCWEGYDPMYRNPLFQPRLSKLAVPSAFPERFVYDEPLSETERASQREAVWLDESIFRAGKQGVDDVVTALKKVQAGFV
jgi:perosamine synthetase